MASLVSTLTKKLKSIGLDQRGADAYVALLELGEGTMSDIAKKAKIKRTTLYAIMQSLRDEGMVSISKHGERIVYVAEDPRVLGARLSEKQAVYHDALPELLSIANFLEKKPKIRYFEGEGGIKEVYRDTLNFPDQELVGWGADKIGTHFDIEYIQKVYLPKRVANKIWVRAIMPDLPEMCEYLGNDDVAMLRQVKHMDPSRFPFDVEINLYGGSRVAFMSFRENMGLIVENKSIYRTLKSIFEQQWESLSN